MKIFIGNLGDEITSPDLYHLFSKFGKVIWANVAKDNNNNSRGFGYVYMNKAVDASGAIVSLNKKQFMQQYLTVSEALCSDILAMQ